MTKIINIQVDDDIFDIIDKRRTDQGISSVEEYIKNIILQVAQRIEKETSEKEITSSGDQEGNEERVKQRLKELGYL